MIYVLIQFLKLYIKFKFKLNVNYINSCFIIIIPSFYIGFYRTLKIIQFMFSNQWTNLPNTIHKSNLLAKRQKFHKQIRRKKVEDYQAKIRAKLFYKNQENYNLLHKIDLKQNLNILAHYEFPKISHSAQQDFFNDYTIVFDIEQYENIKIKTVIQQIFIYATSKHKQHLMQMIEDAQLTKLVEILARKVNYFKSIFLENKRSINRIEETFCLPKIYDQFCMQSTSFQAVDDLFQILNDMLLMFYNNARLISFSIHSITNMLQNQRILKYFMQRLGNSQNVCTLQKIQKIFQHEINNINLQSFRSKTILSAICYFYKNMFIAINMRQIYPQMRMRIFNSYQRLLAHNQTNEQMMFEVVISLIDLYNNNVQQFPEIILQTYKIIIQIMECIQKIIINNRRPQVKLMPKSTQQLCVMSFTILNCIFYYGTASQQIFDKIIDFLDSQYDERIDLIIQEGLKSKQRVIVNNTLQLIRSVCLWGDFMVKIYENPNILQKLYYFSKSGNFTQKKQAICALCNLIEGYFQNKKSGECQLEEIYQTLIQRNNLVEILVENLGQYVDKQLNQQIFDIVNVLSYFWQPDPQIQKVNRFWQKFRDEGGQLKLNSFFNRQQNNILKQKAMQILDNYAVKQNQI